jgi:glycosyltransferase involved in cell wall biosynthesis
MISVTVLTKNCSDTLGATLAALQSFPEVIVLDTGSTDKTLEIARGFPNVKIHLTPFLGFGPTHNLASSLATHDWILSIDSDELPSPPLLQEIENLPLNPECVYAIQRHNMFNGKHIKWCAGWHPDWVVRLYNRRQTCFSDHAVHEQVIAKGFATVRLSSPLFHTPYRSYSDFLGKMETYSTLFAKQNQGKRSSSLSKAILHTALAFFKNYILKRGFLGGREGFIISVYNAHTTYYKYLKLSEQNRK